MSLVKIDEVLLFTVFSESPRRAAITELDRPWAKQPQHIVLTWSQLRKWILVCRSGTESGEYPLRNGGPEDCLAVGDCRHGTEDLLLGCALE